MPRWPPRTLKQRFWAHVEIRGPDECWPWRGSINRPSGYGHFRFKRGSRWTVARAHRIALALGWPGLRKPRSLAEGEEALHRNSCGRSCCNPAHLRPGSATDNNQDVAAKKRERPRYLKPGRELRF